MMLIVVNESDGNKEAILTIDPADYASLAAAVAAEFNIPAGEISLSFAGVTIMKEVPLVSQVTDGATLALRRRKFHLRDVPPGVTPDALLALCEENETLLPQISEADPTLGEALGTKEVSKVRMLMMKRAMKQHKSVFEKERELKAIEADPDNEENQRKIAEIIQKEQIEASHLMAMEENPEVFAQVSMLYVPLEVNGVPLKAFVDSGAQMTIMSKHCAERCNMLRLMDTRYAGIASGVGTGKILGKIHMAQMKFGGSFFPISITVLESQSIDFLFGLDNLKRYRCAIDLHSNTLRMGDGSSGTEEVPFLSEGEMPKEFAHPQKEKEGADNRDTAAAGSLKSEVADPALPPAPPVETSRTADVRTLMELTGCTQAEAEGALEAAEGSLDTATNMLIG